MIQLHISSNIYHKQEYIQEEGSGDENNMMSYLSYERVTKVQGRPMAPAYLRSETRMRRGGSNDWRA